MPHLKSGLTWLGLIAMFAVMFWGDRLQNYSQTLFLVCVVIFAISYWMHLVDGRRERDRRISERAIARYKKEQGITGQ